MLDVVSTLDDESLALRISRRDASAADRTVAVAAYEELYRRHARSVLAFLAARTHGSEREDLLQKVWLKVWEKLPTQFSGGNFRAWLFQIARTQVIDQHRRRPTGAMGDRTSEIASIEDEPGDGLLNQERLEVLRGCLQGLDERESDVIRGLLSGEPYPEICTRLRIDSNAAYKATHSAKAKLRDCVERKLQ